MKNMKWKEMNCPRIYTIHSEGRENEELNKEMEKIFEAYSIPESSRNQICYITATLNGGKMWDGDTSWITWERDIEFYSKTEFNPKDLETIKTNPFFKEALCRKCLDFPYIINMKPIDSLFAEFDEETLA